MRSSGLRKQHTQTPGEEKSQGFLGDFFVEEFMLNGNGSRKPWKCFSKSRRVTWSVLSIIKIPSEGRSSGSVG